LSSFIQKTIGTKTPAYLSFASVTKKKHDTIATRLSNEPRLGNYKWDWFNARNYCRDLFHKTFSAVIETFEVIS
jgi:hypothetical protein